MVHVTCDLCGKELRPGDDQRYVVKIEVFATHDPCELTEDDLDDDHMEAVSELLRNEEGNLQDPEAEDPTHKNLRYDLCPACQKKFLRDPLNREVNLHFDFSEN
jgi:hypothetical protein